MSAIGAFTFVLNSHLPYARLAGRWPHGEEWIHEAASETYVPLLNTLNDLKAEKIGCKLTLGITPILAEQLADDLVLEHFEQYLDNRIEAAERDILHFESDDHKDDHLRYLAEWYRDWYIGIRTSFIERYDRDLIGAFRQLQDDGLLEIITSAATHAYLPLLSEESTLYGQLKLGMQSYERLFGSTPRGVWLPECAYRPGMETILDELGLKFFLTETHTVTGGKPVGIAAGDILGPYGDIKRRYDIPDTAATPERTATPFVPYTVAESSVQIIGRNNPSVQQVWSEEWGYPGDFDYREFHKKAGTSGLQFWRITGENVDLAFKDHYHPDWAKYKVEQHAEHFAHLIGDLLREYHNESEGRFGIVAANFDTELFGHWWFEGVSWLGKVLRHLHESQEIEMMTAGEYLEQHPPREALEIPEGSWGAGGNHFTWNNGEVAWMWEPIHESERRMQALVANFQAPTEDEKAVLNQAAREFLLAQSSDWPFLVTTGQAREYAIQRFNQHLERFGKLADSLDAKMPDRAYADELWELDKVFADIDYRIFGKR